VAQNLLIALSGSTQTAPSYWLDLRTGVTYNVATQTPQYRITKPQDLENIPVANATTAPVQQIMSGLTTVTRGAEMAVVTHYNIQDTIDIYGGVEGRDLGGVARDLQAIIDQNRKDLPAGSQLIVRGQIQTMNASFIGLLAGLGFSIVLVYLLIVVNFQSWLDPFIILMALPAALAGIVWFLFITGTTISVPALT
jgi:multidrug efflux pump subunit AcrB